MRELPILIGTVNPRSRDSALALSPAESGTAGWRLFRMSGMRLEPYLDAFLRTNLSHGVPDLRHPDVAVLLGYDVARRLGAERRFWVRQRLPYDVWAWVVPHPSGLCRHYNDPAARARLANLLHHVRYTHRHRLENSQRDATA